MIFPHPPDIVNNVIKEEVISEEEEEEKLDQFGSWESSLLEHSYNYDNNDCSHIIGGNGSLHTDSLMNGVEKGRLSNSAFLRKKDGLSLSGTRNWSPGRCGQPTGALEGFSQCINTSNIKTLEDVQMKTWKNKSQKKRKAKLFKTGVRKSNNGKEIFVSFKYFTASVKGDLNNRKETKTTPDIISAAEVNACTLERNHPVQRASYAEIQDNLIRNSLSSLSHSIEDTVKQHMVQKQPSQYDTVWETPAYSRLYLVTTVAPSLLTKDFESCQNVGPGAYNNSQNENLPLDQILTSTARYKLSKSCWDQDMNAKAAQVFPKRHCLTNPVASYMQLVFKQDFLKTFESEFTGRSLLKHANNKSEAKDSIANTALQFFGDFFPLKDSSTPSPNYFEALQEVPETAINQRMVSPFLHQFHTNKLNRKVFTYKHYNWSGIEVPKLTDYFHAQIVVKSNEKKKAIVKKILQKKNFKRLGTQFELQLKSYQFRIIDILLYDYIGRSEEEMLCLFLDNRKRMRN